MTIHSLNTINEIVAQVTTSTDSSHPPPTTDIVQKTYESFVKLDANKDGTITVDELTEAINNFSQHLNVNVTPIQSEDIIAIASRSDNERKKLTFSEFYTVYSAMNLLIQLQSHDWHQLTSKELYKALKETGLNPSRPQLERMLVLADKYRTYDRRGKIDLREFLQTFVGDNNTIHSPSHLFLHSWFTAGRNATPYARPVNIDPLHDFAAGTVAGIALTMVGHPFDTIKVRLQTEPTLFSGGLDCLRKTLQSEGIFALFKGMASPMSTIPLVNAITFWAYATAKDTIHKLQTEKAPLSTAEIAMSGGFAGLLGCIVSCPVELIKTRLQIQYSASETTPASNTPFVRGQPTSFTTAHFHSSPAASVGAAGLHTQSTRPYSTLLKPNASHLSTPTATILRQLSSDSTTSAASNASSAASTAAKEASASRRLIFNTQGPLSITAGYQHHFHNNALPCTAGGELPYRPFLGPVDAIKRIYDMRGIKGLYRGMSATMYRELPGFSVQFGTYETLKHYLTPSEKGGELSATRLIFCGGTAGLAGWLVSYPQDYIKSQIQAEPYDRPSPWKKNKYLLDGGFFDCARDTVKRQGWRTLWRGFGTCAVRAFPANAAGFFAYEATLSAFRNPEQ